MELEGAVDSALAWATLVLPTLQHLLDEPFSDLEVHILPTGGLRIAHVLGLVRLLSLKKGAGWSK
eukprot:CAMPEP_0119087194 /NCGR_PEP_ID=MMETSP1178-20130426/140774_1 /TAXON_ID=33656 /ORGANISM="unid sp, Strain CCMP2000" /LENGTH=64 /DNA_ID=CAMNT_0007070381 /DNA_START=6 /DNA_END=197 /DNA_ORIENTATION=-